MVDQIDRGLGGGKTSTKAIPRIRRQPSGVSTRLGISNHGDEQKRGQPDGADVNVSGVEADERGDTVADAGLVIDATQKYRTAFGEQKVSDVAAVSCRRAVPVGGD